MMKVILKLIVCLTLFINSFSLYAQVEELEGVTDNEFTDELTISNPYENLREGSSRYINSTNEGIVASLYKNSILYLVLSIRLFTSSN